jgi:hypothetical protein
LHLINAAKKFPRWVIAKQIIFSADMYFLAKSRVQRGSLDAMMNETLFEKRSRFPALRARA